LGFVFADSAPGLLAATYTPWLFPTVFALGFFFGGLLIYARFHATPGWRADALIGASLGVVFLAHTAPALILGGIITLHTLTYARAQSRTMYQGPDQRLMLKWIANYSEPLAVFAAPDNIGFSIVAAAGRRVVAVDPFFSNPYVEWAPRSDARNDLIHALSHGDCDRFRALASPYQVNYVIVRSDVTPRGLSPCGLTETLTGEYWRIFRLDH